MKDWRIALPCYDVPDAAGASTAVADAPPAAPAEESVSLADHEAAYSPDAGRAPSPDDDDAPPAASERDETGRFKPRHRAQSQRADADDVPLISEHTRRIKDAEAKLGADITRKDGESDRVYNLRRRAELLERFSHAKPAEAPQPQRPAPTPSRQATPPQPPPQQFPPYDVFITFQGYENATYEDYVDARADWRYAIQRHHEREQESQTSAQRTAQERAAAHLARIPAAKQKYADWDTVVTNDAHIGPVLIDAILSSEHSAEIAYYLGKHPQVRNDLNADTPDYSVSAVAAMRRYLDSLVASATSNGSSPSSRSAVAPTGSTPAPVVPPAPRPPNPVRTGSIAAPDTPPGDDDMSLANHEKHFRPRRR